MPLLTSHTRVMGAVRWGTVANCREVAVESCRVLSSESVPCAFAKASKSTGGGSGASIALIVTLESASAAWFAPQLTCRISVVNWEM